MKNKTRRESSVCNLSKMKNQIARASAFPAEKSINGIIAVPSSQFHASPEFRKSKVNAVIGKMSRIGEKVDNFAQGIREHVKIGSKITEIVKGKLSLGVKILQVGGVKRIFNKNFSVKEEEELLKVSPCYLSTTAGPLAGLLFISTDKIAFRSKKSIKICSPTGDFHRVHYKVVIPLGKIKRAYESENMNQPSKKYIEIVTEDDFEFWFMAFLNYRRTIKYIHHAITQFQ